MLLIGAETGLETAGALYAGVAVYALRSLIEALRQGRPNGHGPAPAELCMKHEKAIGVLLEKSEAQGRWLQDIDRKLDRLLDGCPPGKRGAP